jgi:hypothetical protein
LPAVCPASILHCRADHEIETLQATVRIAKPPTDTTVAVDIPSGASLGQAGSGTLNTATGRLSKPTLDGVYLGRGCAPTGCTDVVTQPGNVYADGPIRAYDREPPPKLPRLDDQVSIVPEVTRDDYAACSGPGSCNAATGAAVTGSGNDFFISHAFRILATTLEDDRSSFTDCDADGLLRSASGTVGCTTRNLYDILTKDPTAEPDARKRWTTSTPTFRKTLRCDDPNPTLRPLLTCDEGTPPRRVTGSVAGAVPPYLQTPTAYVVEWRGADWAVYGGNPTEANTLRIYACDPGCATMALLAPSNPGADVVSPLLLYVDGPLKMCQGCSGQTFFYQGHAIFLARGTTADISSNLPSIAIDAELRARCDPLCSEPQVHTTFPQRSLLTFYTPGNIFLGTTGPRPYLGRFYAGNKLVTTQQIDLVGEATARLFDLGTQVPRFWEVKLPLTPTALPARARQGQPPRGAARWTVSPLKWKECTGPATDQPC